ncbi:glycosyltransferase family 8 protein [Hypoxylon trugodes]|uniref:glycosyltransferase family 8 protein n=1 Tax=Hypoxylon trugodes TaxID=326681 RepID=UPI0021A16EB2|nr:glycosyltransferase family 8 protein [Hypoxylon trugodes]KAI1391319.1 glycosyltransferase family 8 protein [Hypoxylon trugodes]
MAVQGGAEEDVYATLLLSDTYLPGALVLAHSLRDAGTTKKLAVLVTLDTVSADVITQLKTLYDYVIPVGRIRNSQPANLHLMNRADLHSAFTKINLWKQTHFRKIVYIDCDVVAYRAPDELFNISHSFSAAPDIGWPDLFNTGVMVLTPNLGDYYAMIAMAERNISFDGADQGLINMHFKNNYNRLSFTYNVTPSGHYQYVPAYRHFQSGISMVHFIGPEKPWFKGRRASTGSSLYDEMTGRWWAVYDRHYRVPTPAPTPSILGKPATTSTAKSSTTITPTTTQPSIELVQFFTKGEYQPKATHFQITGELHSGVSSDPHQHVQPPVPESYSHEHGHREPFHSHDASHSGPHGHGHYDHGVHQHHGHVEAPSETTAPQLDPSTSFQASSFHTNVEGTHTEAREGQVPEPSHGAPPPKDEAEQKPPPFQPSMSNWDAQRESPPADSKPEAMNFPATIYEMSHDSTPFVAPQRYPSPPRDMWYEVPKERPAPPSEPPKPIFPWETERAPPSRVFPDERPQNIEPDTGGSETPTGTPWAAPDPQASSESSVTEASTVEQKSEPTTPTTPTIHITPSDPWSSFTLTNAWDGVPEIERYVDKIQKHKRTRSLKSPGVLTLPGFGEEAEITWRRRGSKLTDFPSEAERPSLPVTPAPIRRAKFWGGGPNVGYDTDENPLLPAAEGVPAQTEWDPVAQLQKLAKQQSEALLRKLGGDGRNSSDLPSRPLPFGSEELISPTYVVQSANVLSPQPVKGGVSSSAVHSIESNLEETPRISTQSTVTADTTTIPEPSYAGPGAAFEKGENIPTEDVPTLRIATAGLGIPTRPSSIPEPSYTGPGPAFEKEQISLEEDVD